VRPTVGFIAGVLLSNTSSIEERAACTDKVVALTGTEDGAARLGAEGAPGEAYARRNSGA
jgi:hypothetical protein